MVWLDRYSGGVASVPMLIGGSEVASLRGEVFQISDPATGGTIASVNDGGVEEAVHAVDAASRAQQSWAKSTPRVRSDLLLAMEGALLERIDEFAQLITMEMGKPLAEARGEVAFGAQFLRWYAEESVRISGRYMSAPDGASRMMVVKRPVGPSLLITPWNYPLTMVTRKLAPALAAGCTVVLKPSELTPLTALAFADLAHHVGLPAGVFNVVPTTRADAVTKAALADGRLRKVSFTGSTAVGRHLLRESAAGVLRASMELGGNAPFLVFEDADLDAAVEGAVQAKLRNMGEACTAANRFLVERSVLDEFADRLRSAFSGMRVGNGLDPQTDIGPMISLAGREKTHGLVEDAVARGAKIALGGQIPDSPGSFYPATVLVDVPVGAAILGEEIFGPVAPILAFESEDEAVRMANETSAGLISYVYTRDVHRGLRMAEMLEAGILAVNRGFVSNVAAPFGGVKQSGLGREGGSEGIHEFLESVYVCFDDPFVAATTS